MVTLTIDEVYTAQRIEYQNGKLVGRAEDDQHAKTVSTFMDQSLFSKFKDVLFLVHIDTLNSLKLKSYFDSLLEQLCRIVFVQAVGMDNYIVNRSLYEHLCGNSGILKTSVEHSCVADQHLFVI